MSLIDGGEVVALAQQVLGPLRKLVQTIEQLRRRPRCADRFDSGAARGQRVLRNIDAVEILVVFLAILQMIDDLQRRAQRVVCRPHRTAFAVHVADETADRHRRQRAIADQIVPVLIAQLGDVELERGDEILRVLGREIALGKRRAQPRRDRIFGTAAEEARFEAIEQRELFRRRQRRVVGDVVGGADEIIERQNHRAMARMNQERRHREILVPMPLAGAQFVSAVCIRVVHLVSETLACARPFHMPPRPRAC